MSINLLSDIPAYLYIGLNFSGTIRSNLNAWYMNNVDNVCISSLNDEIQIHLNFRNAAWRLSCSSQCARSTKHRFEVLMFFMQTHFKFWLKWNSFAFYDKLNGALRRKLEARFFATIAVMNRILEYYLLTDLVIWKFNSNFVISQLFSCIIHRNLSIPLHFTTYLHISWCSKCKLTRLLTDFNSNYETSQMF